MKTFENLLGKPTWNSVSQVIPKWNMIQVHQRAYVQWLPTLGLEPQVVGSEVVFAPANLSICLSFVQGSAFLPQDKTSRSFT